MSVSAFATTKAFRPVSASNGTIATSDFGSSSMSMPPRWVSVIVGARKMGVVGDREIDLVLGRHPGLEGHAVRLGIGVAVPVLAEVEPLLLGQRLLQRPRLADQPGLAFLADAAAEHRLDEDQPMPVDQIPGWRPRTRPVRAPRTSGSRRAPVVSTPEAVRSVACRLHPSQFSGPCSCYPLPW